MANGGGGRPRLVYRQVLAAGFPQQQILKLSLIFPLRERAGSGQALEGGLDPGTFRRQGLRADLLDETQESRLVGLSSSTVRRALRLREQDVPAGLDEDRISGVGVPLS